MDEMTLISMGSTVASLGGAFAVVRYQVGSIMSTLEDVEARLRALDNRIDKNSTQLDVLTQRQGVISAMLDPANMERRAREAERLITEVEHLKRQRDSK
jgi:hypothetical protein|tara:strand:- start:84 stop:380 length:297 start_codon:yes stop_codon:yes gene_type:complete